MFNKTHLVKHQLPLVGTVGTGKNAMAVDPMTVNYGVTITVPDGSTLIIV